MNASTIGLLRLNVASIYNAAQLILHVRAVVYKFRFALANPSLAV